VTDHLRRALSPRLFRLALALCSVLAGGLLFTGAAAFATATEITVRATSHHGTAHHRKAHGAHTRKRGHHKPSVSQRAKPAPSATGPGQAPRDGNEPAGGWQGTAGGSIQPVPAAMPNDQPSQPNSQPPKPATEEPASTSPAPPAETPIGEPNPAIPQFR
jgi:hypothetical protein